MYLDLYLSTHEKVLHLGEFNPDIEEKHMKCFCESSMKQPSYYKNPDSLIVLIYFFIKFSQVFPSTYVLETGVPEFHIISLTVIEKTLSKWQPIFIN